MITFLFFFSPQNKINAFLKDRDSINEVEIPQWMPFSLINHPEGFCNEGVTVKLLCGADLLESFATPGLWNYDDVSLIYFSRILYLG